MMLERVALVVGALALVSLASPAEVSGGQMIEREFRASYAGTYQNPQDITHECPAGQFPNLVLGDGVGSLVGRFDLRIEACVDPFTGLVTGTAFYTAANGDLLAFEFEGFGVPQPDGSIVSTLPATGAFGTGRFANVQLGSAHGVAVDTTVGSSSSGYVEGPIVYDASNRNGR